MPLTSDGGYEVKYICGPVTKRFHEDRASRVKLIIGPFGTGKTSAGAFDIIECQSRRVRPSSGIRKSRFAVVRNTYPELRDTTIKTYLDWWPPEIFGTYHGTEKRYTIRIDDREIEIIFKALDTPKDVRDLLSLELTGAHVDEAREIHQDVVKGLLGRIGRYPSLKDTSGLDPFLTPPQITLSTNYPSTRHPLYRDFVSHRIDGYTIYEQKQSENKHNLRKGYYEDLERDYASRPDLLRTLVRGEWGVTVEGQAVYTTNEFNRAVHVSKVSMFPQEPTLIIRGWDNTGLAPAIILTYFSTWGQWRPFKEFCFKDTGIMDAAEAVIHFCLQQLPPGCKFRDIADPAGRTRDSSKQSPADYIAQKSQQMGHYIRLEEGVQTFKVRREAVANRLTRMINGQPAILIDPSCETLIEGFEGGYAYPEIGNSGEFKTEPMKNDYSHIHDSLQYPATRLFTHSDIERDEDEEREREKMTAQGRSRVGGY
jgi:hypothetical protein